MQMQHILTIWVMVARLVWGNIEVIYKHTNKGVLFIEGYLQGTSTLVNSTVENS